ncbi:Rab3 GTPase-activating protein catalytic subunit-domain-containing protein [Gigaspora rosea]|uniref:Rab3 GTPase-activating protein catalytic subunit n=1 Tax=Gigaspora rosea TaxID=44941 RepID=A0A397VBG9_9GLOM|nr:Rab3 GTPase-activating protein catalytic subunit-domain-containing protein [Gigaspora rosea]
MDVSCPTSPIDDDEHFEFVDYTAASQWERFITTVEEILVSWKVTDGQLGIFDESNLPPLSHKTYNKTVGGIDPFVKREIIVLEDKSYTLSYHYHPIKRWNEFNSLSASSTPSQHFPPPPTATLFPPNSDPFSPSSEFLPYTLPNFSHDLSSVNLNTIHRWTGLTHILVLTPTDIFSSGSIQKSSTIDLSTTKILLSSFAIVFHNIKCKLPVFVPTGQITSSLYAGYMCWFNKDRSKNVEDASEMDLNQLPFDQVDELKSDKMPHLGISVASLFTYELQNLDDQDWKNLDYDDVQPTSLNGSSDLPFGPINDPLESISLTAFFPSAPSNTYLDNDVYSEMDAMGASIWLLKCKFYEESNLHCLLSSLIDNTISSWIIDGGSTHLEDSNSNNRNREPRQIPNRDLPGSFNNYDLFETVRYVRQSTGVIVDMDDADIDNILRVLFNVPQKKRSVPYYNSEKIKTSSGISLPSAATLGLHLNHGRAVPYKSFMWNLLEYLLETVSRASNFRSYSLLGSLKIVWNEVLKRIRWHWERNDPIPDISIYNGSDNSSSLPFHRDRNGSTIENKSGQSFDKNDNATVGIDMRFNLVHQKLCMINCCIERLRQSQKNNPTLSTSFNSSKEQLPESNSFGSLGSSSIKPDKSSGLDPKMTNSDNFLVRLFDYITEDDEVNIDPSSSMVVVRPENSNGASRADITSATTTATNGRKYSNHVHSPSLDFESVHQDYDVSSEDDFFDTINEAPAVPLRIPRSSKSYKFHSRQQSSISQGQSYSSTPPSFSDHSDPNQISSLTESYVKLDYSASLESNKGFDKEKLTINEDDVHREVNDENEREGFLHPFNGLTLLETGEPLWVPETQEVGFMTEDMLREQEEIFEKLGTSENATKARAQMQSVHLLSDMQAFKAANPHAILEDFIRWHSPRDWIPDNDDPNKGTLSQRMLEEGNLWQELWKKAQRIPASRQSPLFKCSLEAEKALHYLEHLSVKDLFKMLLPTMFLIAYDTLVSHPVTKNIKQVASGLENLMKELTKFPWNDIGSGNISCDEIIQMIRQNELLIGRAISLLRKLPKQYSLVEKLLEIPEGQVSDGKERESVYKLFSSVAPLNDSFPPPTTREFVLQTTCLRPTPVPARMYVLLNNNEMRIVDMVGKDTIFM